MTKKDFSLPECRIPFNEEDYKKRVDEFYEKEKETELLQFINKLEKENNLEYKIKLDLDGKTGLTNITAMGGGLDLTKDWRGYSYNFHNYSAESEVGKILFEVAKKYVKLLSC